MFNLKSKIEENKARDRMLESYDKVFIKAVKLALEDPDGYLEKFEKLEKYLEENFGEVKSDETVNEFLKFANDYFTIRSEHELKPELEKLF